MQQLQIKLVMSELIGIKSYLKAKNEEMHDSLLKHSDEVRIE